MIYREHPEIASILLKAGCDPNSKSHNDHTSLIIAASKGHIKILNVLLKWPTTKLSEQVSQSMCAQSTVYT